MEKKKKRLLISVIWAEVLLFGLVFGLPMIVNFQSFLDNFMKDKIEFQIIKIISMLIIGIILGFIVHKID